MLAGFILSNLEKKINKLQIGFSRRWEKTFKIFKIVRITVERTFIRHITHRAFRYDKVIYTAFRSVVILYSKTSIM